MSNDAPEREIEATMHESDQFILEDGIDYQHKSHGRLYLDSHVNRLSKHSDNTDADSNNYQEEQLPDKTVAKVCHSVENDIMNRKDFATRKSEERNAQSHNVSDSLSEPDQENIGKMYPCKHRHNVSSIHAGSSCVQNVSANPQVTQHNKHFSSKSTPRHVPSTRTAPTSNANNVAVTALSLLEELFGCGAVLESLNVAAKNKQTPSEQVKQLLTQQLLNKAWTSQSTNFPGYTALSSQNELMMSIPSDGCSQVTDENIKSDNQLFDSGNVSVSISTSDEQFRNNTVITPDSKPLKGFCGHSSPRSSIGDSYSTDECFDCSIPTVQNAAIVAGLGDVAGGLTRQVCLLKMQLHEASRALQLEREERCDLSASAARYQAEAIELRGELQTVRCNRQEAVKQVECLRSQLQQLQHQQHQLLVQETAARQMAEAKLAEIRADLERMQQENSTEWSRREFLESEALSLERCNKVLKVQVDELREQLKQQEQLVVSQKSNINGSSVDGHQEELTSLQEQLSDAILCLGQLKKTLTCKTVECEHSSRRADQYEVEVKRLRHRVATLRHDLAATQDELDTAGNNTRRLARSKEELQDTADTLQLKLDHLQSRLKSTVRNKKLLPLCDSDDETG